MRGEQPVTNAFLQCDGCGQIDDHPKHHYGAETYHHDCTPHRIVEDMTSLSEWDRDSEGQLVLLSRTPLDPRAIAKETADALAIMELAKKGMRGDKLRKHIQSGKPLTMRGGASGLDSGTSALVLAAINGGTAFTITGPLKCLFLSAVRATATGTDTEWATGGGYTLGTGFSGVTFAAVTAGAPSTQNSNIAVTITNCPAQTWAGNKIVDSAGTPKTTFWGTITGGNKTVNAGDTCTVPSGSLQTSLG
jgi:hypothetical protein